MLALWLTVLFPPACLAEGSSFDPSYYGLHLTLDLAHGSLTGEEHIHLDGLGTRYNTIRLSADDLKIDRVTLQGKRAAFSQSGGQLIVPVPAQERRDSAFECVVWYHASPRKGLHISKDEVFTAFNTSAWMVCDDAPASKASFELWLELPSEFKVVAAGTPLETTPLHDSTTAYHWIQRAAIPAYTIGFAAGRYNEQVQSERHIRYRFLTIGYSNDQVSRIFHSTDSIFHFFSNLTGKDYPYSDYTQVLTRAENEQEASRFALLSSDYGNEVLADPRENWLIVHEAAHQWFGNIITCATWSDFWLNEGMVTFLTALYKESALGRDEYDREFEMARLRYGRVKGASQDRPIVTDNWSKPSDMGGIITYYKGALVLNYLRYVIGDSAFVAGLREYVHSHWWRTVTTHDLEFAMEESSNEDLAWFFKEWVFTSKVPTLRAAFKAEKDSLDIVVEQSDTVDQLPLQIAVETSLGRSSYRVVLDKAKQTFRFAKKGDALSVRLDDGGHLPVEIELARPVTMLLYQAVHEPDLFGRIDALTTLNKKSGELTPSARSAFKSVLQDRAQSDSSRLVRGIAQKLLAARSSQ